MGVAVVDDKLFAFGGYDGTSRLATVECYDSKVCKITCYLCRYLYCINSCRLMNGEFSLQ